MKNGRLKFRILSDDIKVVEIDSKLSAAVGSADAKEMKTLVLALMTSGGFNHQTLKTFVFVLVRTYPWLWDYLTEVRRRLDDRGEA